MRTIYSALYRDFYPFHNLGEVGVVAHTADSLKDTNSVLLLWGGADVTPSYYHHKQSSQTYNHESRDAAEWGMIQRAIALGIPIIGVCRGAQMLCAAAGGYLFQHTTGHAIGRLHTVKTFNGEEFETNSLHHQMLCVPDKVDHSVLAWSETNLSSTYIYDGEKEHTPPEKELECVWFPSIKGLAVQWHPEMMDECPATDFILKEIYERLETVPA